MILLVEHLNRSRTNNICHFSWASLLLFRHIIKQFLILFNVVVFVYVLTYRTRHDIAFDIKLT